MPPGVGPYCFRIQGAIYYKISTLEVLLDFSRFQSITNKTNNHRFSYPANRRMKHDALCSYSKLFKCLTGNVLKVLNLFYKRSDNTATK